MNANSMPASSRRQRHRQRHRLLFVTASLLAFQLGSSPSLAQQYPGGGAGAGGGRDYDEYYSHEEYADRRYRPDSLYADYAASHQSAGGGGAEKALTKKGVMVKLALAFGGGWVGAKAHTFLKMRRAAPPKLRFRVGERVLCHMGNDQWVQGTVVKLWPQQGQGQYVPYLIRLDDHGSTAANTSKNKKKGGGGNKKSSSNREAEGQIIYAPADHDGVIRAASR